MVGKFFRGWCFAIITFQVLLAHQSFGAPIFGRYIGYVRHEGIKRDQLAKLDFITSREDGNVIHLKAVLTLHFGDFKSKEYVSYHFDNVRFNLLTQIFVFDQADQPVTLVGKLASANEFSGLFRSAFSGEIGKVVLRSDKPAAPELPLVELLWGEYRGKCESKVEGRKVETIVQVYPFRSNEGAGQVGNPYRAYKIKGFVGETSEKGCGLSTGRECVWGNIKSGAYNFFKNRLILFNTYRNLSCVTEADGLSCEGCDFLKRASSETKGERAFSPPVATSAISIGKPDKEPALQSDIDSIQGEYKGYVHHEYLDHYQVGSLNILTYQASGETGSPTLRMSAIGTLYFGPETGIESISYRFKERSYPNPLMTPQFVFSEAQSDVDALLQVTYLGKGIVRGIWFSHLFGRVGNFEFRKDGLPKLPADAKVMEAVSGQYEGNEWEMEVLVGMGTAAPNTENPFAPLTFGGWTLMTSVTPKIHFTGGSYDFYTGRIGFEFGESLHLGDRVSRKRLLLKKMNYAALAPLPPHPLQPYRFVGDSTN